MTYVETDAPAFAAPDRLRFLGTVSRYVSVVRHVSLDEKPSPAASTAAASADADLWAREGATE